MVLIGKFFTVLNENAAINFICKYLSSKHGYHLLKPIRRNENPGLILGMGIYFKKYIDPEALSESLR